MAARSESGILGIDLRVGFWDRAFGLGLDFETRRLVEAFGGTMGPLAGTGVALAEEEESEASALSTWVRDTSLLISPCLGLLFSELTDNLFLGGF